ncbi:MAG TPA: AI-2E family transporter [Burkholderiales bacterium]|nr:AI-2E family transporter [Burkholderiales bacterium]
MNNKCHLPLINTLFITAILIATTFILKSFLITLAWAGILGITTWPLHLKVSKAIHVKPAIGALISTLLVAMLIGLPLVWLGILIGAQLSESAKFMINANQSGLPPPGWLQTLPFIGKDLSNNWNDVLGHANGVASAMHSYASKMGSFSQLLEQTSFQILHRTLNLVFTLLTLFFLFRDGASLARIINGFGNLWVPDHWQAYAASVPAAIRATVNGLIFVGLGEGLILGIAYAITGIKNPALPGILTGLAAIIPFGAPIIFCLVAIFLFAKGQIIGGTIIMAVGWATLFIADHIIRPWLIGGATKLHFLAVLFGLLGGVEALGLVGLFIGPAVMAVFSILWNDAVTHLKLMAQEN